MESEELAIESAAAEKSAEREKKLEMQAISERVNKSTVDHDSIPKPSNSDDLALKKEQRRID